MEIVEYSDKYRDSAINLVEKTFSRSNYDAQFSWRFEKPSEYRPIIVCAVESGKVISFNSWIKWLFTWEGETFVGYQSGESATDYNYRGMGIWRRLIKFGEDIARQRGYIDFLFGFPNNNSFGILLKAGYLHAGTYSKKLRFINPLLSVPKHEGNKNLVDATGLLYLPEKNKLTPITDSNYMEWRYNQNPNEYRIIHYSEKDSECTFILAEGMFYSKRFRLGIPKLRMVDCRFTSTDWEFIHNSFKYLDRMFSRKTLWISTFMNEETQRERILKPHFHINWKDRDQKLVFKKSILPLTKKYFAGSIIGICNPMYGM